MMVIQFTCKACGTELEAEVATTPGSRVTAHMATCPACGFTRDDGESPLPGRVLRAVSRKPDRAGTPVSPTARFTVNQAARAVACGSRVRLAAHAP